MRKILIIGRVPPPIGGVTTHVKRLVEALRRRTFPVEFCDLGNDGRIACLSKILRHSKIHLHVSNPGAQLLFAAFCRLMGKKLLITYHGRWGRYRRFGNWAVKWSARLAYVPVVQDEYSLAHALECNARAQRITTYIPPGEVRPLAESLRKKIVEYQKKYEATFCTNAWNVTFDKYGKEVYGICSLIKRFQKYPQYLLLVSDPSGKYRQWLADRNIPTPDNIVLISHPHDFHGILLLADAFIRNTTTDGVSLSIHEAFELKVAVLASASVTRPAFCSVFDDILETDLKAKLEEARQFMSRPVSLPDAVEELINLYSKLDNQL